MDIRKIAIVSSSFHPSGGGVSSAHYNLYRVLKKRGYDVRVFTNADPDRSSIEDVLKRSSPAFIQRILRYSLSLYFRMKNDKNYHRQLHYILNSAWASFALRRPIKKYQPDVLIVPDVSASAFFIGKIQHCKTILIAHHNPARFLHNPLIQLHSELDAQLAIAIENRALQNVDKVICPSQYMKEIFLQTYKFDKPVVVVPNIVDETLIESVKAESIARECGLPKNATVVYIPSAGSDIKGSKYVFEIIRRLNQHCIKVKKEICFYLSGNLTNELVYELNLLKPSAKIFSPGKLTYERNIAFIKSCSFMVSPTLLESFGMAQLEALYCNLPVVSFDVGGNKEIIIHGENGFIVPYLDVENLIAYAKQLCDSKVRLKIKKKIIKTILSRFPSDKTIDNFIKELGS
jgi:glycosyltransferase involved in cell wall biosynthesis